MRAFEIGDDCPPSVCHSKRRCFAGRAARLVDEHGSVHLSAGADRRDPLARAADRRERVADRCGDAGPPVERPLLRPPELRHDLIVLAGGDVQ